MCDAGFWKGFRESGMVKKFIGEPRYSTVWISWKASEVGLITTDAGEMSMQDRAEDRVLTTNQERRKVIV